MSLNVSAAVAVLRGWVQPRQREPLAWQLCQVVAAGLRARGWPDAEIADLLGCSEQQAAEFVAAGQQAEHEWWQRNEP